MAGCLGQSGLRQRSVRATQEVGESALPLAADEQAALLRALKQR